MTAPAATVLAAATKRIIVGAQLPDLEACLRHFEPSARITAVRAADGYVVDREWISDDLPLDAVEVALDTSPIRGWEALQNGGRAASIPLAPLAG